MEEPLCELYPYYLTFTVTCLILTKKLNKTKNERIKNKICNKIVKSQFSQGLKKLHTFKIKTHRFYYYLFPFGVMVGQ